MTLRGYEVLWAAAAVPELNRAHSKPGSVEEGRPGGEAATQAAPASEVRHTVGQNLQLDINFRKTAHI